MKHQGLYLAFTIVLAWSLATIGAIHAQEMNGTALSGNAEIYRVEAIRYGDVFPEGADAAPDDPVLLFESHKPGEPIQREVVPGTEGYHLERSPNLLLDAATDTLYMVWETRINGMHSRLKLVSRDADGWSETIEIYGNPYLFKGNPQMAVTRDTFVTEKDGEETMQRRVILHLIWTERISEAEEQVLYSPLILLDGEYIGWNPVYRLSEVVAPALGEVSMIAAETAYTPTIQPGGNLHSVVIGFLDPAKGRLVSLEVAVLPGELSFMGDAARAQLIEIGMRKDLPELADRARAQLIEIGHRFNPLLVQHLADALHQLILGQDAETVDIEALADLARAQLIEIGIRFRQGLLPMQDAARAQLIEIGHRFEPQRARHDLRTLLVRHFPLPDGPAGHPVTLFLSDQGQEMLAVWESEEQKVSYQETANGSWSPPQALLLGAELDRAQAYELLEERVHSR